MRIIEMIDAVDAERVRLDIPITEHTEKERLGQCSKVTADIGSDGSAVVTFGNAENNSPYHRLENASPANMLVLARFFLRVYGKMTGEIE